MVPFLATVQKPKPVKLIVVKSCQFEIRYWLSNQRNAYFEPDGSCSLSPQIEVHVQEKYQSLTNLSSNSGLEIEIILFSIQEIYKILMSKPTTSRLNTCERTHEVRAVIAWLLANIFQKFGYSTPVLSLKKIY